MARTDAADWLGVAPGHPFGLQTLPYGSFTTVDRPTEPRAGVAIGDRVLDLTATTYRLWNGRADLFSSGRLDAFLAAGDRAWAQMRMAITRWLSSDDYREALEDLLVPVADVTMHLPFTVADYADFFPSEHHASNAGRILPTVTSSRGITRAPVSVFVLGYSSSMRRAMALICVCARSSVTPSRRRANTRTERPPRSCKRAGGMMNGTHNSAFSCQNGGNWKPCVMTPVTL